MNKPSHNPGSTLRPEHAAALESLLRDLTAHHQTAFELCARHRAAIARADLAAIGSCVVEQQALGSRLSDLDARRHHLVRLTCGNAGAGVRLIDLANRAAEPMRTALLKQAAQLRELMTHVAREQQTLRQTSEALLAHMKGLMTQVSRQLSATGTYARTHTPPEHAQVLTGIDLTT